MSQLGDAGLSGNQILAKINAMLTQQTTLLAANDIFWMAVRAASRLGLVRQGAIRRSAGRRALAEAWRWRQRR